MREGPRSPQTTCGAPRSSTCASPRRPRSSTTASPRAAVPDLADRAVDLGWARDTVTVIDDDLGVSGAGLVDAPASPA